MAFFGGEAPVPEAPAEFAVLSRNWDAVMLFLACGTQWRRGGMSGGATGLDYAAVRAVADARGLAWTDALLAQLRDIEDGALEAFDERARRAAEAAP